MIRQTEVVDAAGYTVGYFNICGIRSHHANVALQEDGAAFCGRIMRGNGQPTEHGFAKGYGNPRQAIESLAAEVLRYRLQRLTLTVSEENRPMD